MLTTRFLKDLIVSQWGVKMQVEIPHGVVVQHCLAFGIELSVYRVGCTDSIKINRSYVLV